MNRQLHIASRTQDEYQCDDCNDLAILWGGFDTETQTFMEKCAGCWMCIAKDLGPHGISVDRMFTVEFVNSVKTYPLPR